jgi:Xaa-Pro aminopeptidase
MKEGAALKARCLDQRRSKVAGALSKQGLAGIIAYGSGRHSFLASNPAWYLSGFRQIGPHMAVILPADGEPAVIITPAWDRQRLVDQVKLETLFAVEPDKFLPTLRREVERRGLARKPLAVAGGVQPRLVSDAWPTILAQTSADGDRLVSDISRIRDEWSLDCVRRGAAIAERGWARALEIARPGMAEFELAAEIEAFMRAEGAEDNFQLLSASQHNRAAHRPSNHVLAAGDVLLGEITPAVEGEYLQICRTAVLGAPSAEQSAAFTLLDKALHGAMKAALPGTPAKQIVEIMNRPIVEAGYEMYTKPPYMRTRGHSMALGSMDPEIATDSQQVLEEGMVFVLHPNQYLPETGYMMCGEPVLITPDGARPLTSKMGTLGAIAI